MWRGWTALKKSNPNHDASGLFTSAGNNAGKTVTVSHEGKTYTVRHNASGVADLVKVVGDHGSHTVWKESHGPATGVKAAVLEKAKGSGSSPTPPKPTTPPDLSGLKKVGSQLGSNPGGQYVDQNGTKFYVKQSKSDDHAKNEVLATKLYQAAGSPIVDSNLIDVGGGKLGTVSQWQTHDGKFNPNDQAQKGRSAGELRDARLAQQLGRHWPGVRQPGPDQGQAHHGRRRGCAQLPGSGHAQGRGVRQQRG